MAHSAMVSIDISLGERMVRLLEDADMKFSVALWLLTEEYSDWRFVVATKSLDALTPLAQLARTQGILRKSIPAEQLPTLWIMNTHDDFPKRLRKLLGSAKSVEGMRLGGQFIGDRFVEDAYVYRIH